MLQGKGSYRGEMQDGDHTDGHYITPFAEQLTRTFEVLVGKVLPRTHRLPPDVTAHTG